MMIFPRKLWIAGTLLSLLLIGIGFALMRGEGPPAFIANPPSPNAYVIWSEAASKLVGPNPRFVTNNYAAVYEPNRAPLEKWREGLKHRGELPEDRYHPRNNPMAELGSIQSLATTASLEALECEQNSQWDKAAEIYLGIVRAGHAVARGPIISLLFGISIEKRGLDGLNRVAAQLTPVQRAKLAGELAESHRTRPTMDEIRQRERYFLEQNASNVFISFLAPLAPQFKKALQQVEGKLERIRKDLEETLAKLQKEGDDSQ
jgi:hypothetical protein